MQIGRRIYFDKSTGDVLVDTGNRQGSVTETTVEQDIEVYEELAERVRASYDYINLEYNQYTQDFAESNGYRVDPKTKILEFSYPDPNEPEIEQPYQAPLSEQIAANTDYLLEVDFRLIMIELGMD